MFHLFTSKKVFENSVRNYLRLALKHSSYRATAAHFTPGQRYVTVDVNCTENTTQNEQLKYPLIWLRDNCQCSHCFDPQTRSRMHDWTTFDFKNAQPQNIAVDQQLKVTWSDNHMSKFDIDWLVERSFTDANKKRYLEEHYQPKLQLWSKKQFELKTFQASDVLESDEGLYEWLQTLVRYGTALIKGAPLVEDQITKLINRVAFVRQTLYGKEYAVRAYPEATNFAYTTNPLQMHTDLPYYDYVPGCTLLHTLAQTKSAGAFSLLVDGFYVANRLRRENPKVFECLTKTIVNWSDYGEDSGVRFETIQRTPMISLDFEGNVTRIRHSVPQRDSFFTIDVEKVDEWYAALKIFIDLLYEEAVYFKMDTGDILAFSNTRLLHGRTGYEDKEGNVRHLAGAYLDWDEVFSRLRVLANERRQSTERVEVRNKQLNE